MARNALMHRLAAGDRALYVRWVIGESASREQLIVWTALTHAGGLSASIAFALVPLVFADASRKVAFVQAGWALALAFLFVQVIKRNTERARPTEEALRGALVRLPDRFSFPSGHATAVMSVAFVHAMNFPAYAAPILLLAVLVGISRVRLGAHYPGDVLAGQLIGILTGAMVRALW